jgi:hypothetical protein
MVASTFSLFWNKYTRLSGAGLTAHILRWGFVWVMVGEYVRARLYN